MPLYVGGGGQFKNPTNLVVSSGNSYPIGFSGEAIGTDGSITAYSGLIRNAVVNGSVAAAGTLTVLAAAATQEFYLLECSISALTAGDVTLEWTDGQDIFRTHLGANGIITKSFANLLVGRAVDNLGFQIRNNSVGAVTYSCSISYATYISGAFV